MQVKDHDNTNLNLAPEHGDLGEVVSKAMTRIEDLEWPIAAARICGLGMEKGADLAPVKSTIAKLKAGE